MDNLAESSNFIVEQNKTCFSQFRGNRYSEARRLREIFQAQQRHRFVATAMMLEIKACRVPTELNQSIPIALQMGELLLQQPQKSIKYRGAVLTRFLSAKLMEMNMRQISTNLDSIKSSVMSQITPHEYSDWKRYCPSMAADQEKEAIVRSESPLLSKCNDLNALAIKCINDRNYTRANQIFTKIRDLCRAAYLAGSLGNEGGFALMRVNGWKYIIFHKENTHMAYWEAAALCDYISHGHLSDKSHREYLHLIQDFEGRHKDMAIPNTLERMFDLGKISAKALDDRALYKRYSNLYLSVINKCSFSGTSGGLADESIINPDCAFRVICEKGTDALSCGVGALHLMLRWAAYEIGNGQLSATRAAVIFNDADLDLVAASSNTLKKRSEPLFKKICGTEEDLTPSVDFLRTYSHLLAWILEPERLPSRHTRLFALRYLMQSRIFLQGLHLAKIRSIMDSKDVNEQATFNEANNAMSQEESVLDVLTTLETVETRIRSTETDERSIHRTLRYCYNFSRHTPIDMGIIDDAVTICYRLIRIHSENNALLKWYHCLVQLVRLEWQKSIRRQTFTASEVGAIIDIVVKADAVFEKIRAALSAQDASAELAALVKNANDFLQSEHYLYAFAALYCRYHLLIAGKKEVSPDAQHVVDTLAKWSLIAKGKSLMKIIQSAQIGPPLNERKSKDATYSDFAAEINSGPSNPNQLSSQDIMKMLTNDVTVVELVNTSYSTLHTGMAALLYRKGQPISVVDIALGHEEITEWIFSNLDAPNCEKAPLSMSGSQTELDKLQRLIEPFLDPEKTSFIPEGVTIIWCSTGALHRVPVHAISTRDKLFIHRNPIIYVQSLSLLHHIWKRTTCAKPVVPLKRAIVNPLPPKWNSTIAAKEIATLLAPVQALHGENISKSDVLQALQGCEIFNFQGHAKFAPANPLNSVLKLGEGIYLTVQEILREVKLGFPALCTLFACASGKAGITSTDDILSLPTALHYAGASSILSTLWPVDEEDGAKFAMRFYQEMLTASKRIVSFVQSTELIPDSRQHESSKLVNLARIMQSTITSIYDEATDEESKLPYHWAAFTINGFWLFSPIQQYGSSSLPRPTLDANTLAKKVQTVSLEEQDTHRAGLNT